jgi:hypothetical protein
MQFDDLLIYCKETAKKNVCVAILDEKINYKSLINLFSPKAKNQKNQIKKDKKKLYIFDGTNYVSKTASTIKHFNITDPSQGSRGGAYNLVCDFFNTSKIKKFNHNLTIYKKIYSTADKLTSTIWDIHLVLQKINNVKKDVPSWDNYDNVYIECNYLKHPNKMTISDVKILKFYLLKFIKPNTKGGDSHNNSNDKEHILNLVNNVNDAKFKHLNNLFPESQLVNRTDYFNKILMNINKFQLYKICTGVEYNIVLHGDKIYYVSRDYITSENNDSVNKSLTVLSAVKTNDKFCIRAVIIENGKYLDNSAVENNTYNKTYGELLNVSYTTHYQLSEKTYKSQITSECKSMKSNDVLEFMSNNIPFYDNTQYQWLKTPPYITFLCKKCPVEFIHKYCTDKNLTTYILYLTSNMHYKNIGLDPLEETKQIFSNLQGFYFPQHFASSTNPTAFIFNTDIIDLNNEYINLTWKPKKLTDKSNWVFISKSKRINTLMFGDDFKYTELNTWNYYHNPVMFKDIILSVDDIKTQMYFPFEKKKKTYEHVVKYNSFVKGLLIEKISGKLNQNNSGQITSRSISGQTTSTYTIDMASGKGQDLFRYYNSDAKKMLMIEIDKDAIDILIGRKYEIQNNSKVSVDVLNANLNDSYKINLDKIKLIRQYSESYKTNQIYCFFALHYLTDTLPRIKNITVLISSLLQKTGEFLYTSFDKARVMEVLGKSGKWEVYEGQFRKYSIIKTGTSSIKLIIPLNPEEYYSETLIDDDMLDKEFKKCGMIPKSEGNFADYLQKFKEKKSYLFREFKPHDEIFVSLYKYKIYTKTK